MKLVKFLLAMFVVAGLMFTPLSANAEGEIYRADSRDNGKSFDFFDGPHGDFRFYPSSKSVCPGTNTTPESFLVTIALDNGEVKLQTYPCLDRIIVVCIDRDENNWGFNREACVTGTMVPLY